MIAKAKSISHLSASINYALRREQATVLDKNIVAEKPGEVVKEFKFFQDLNQRCERNTFSFVISPTINDGKKLSDEQLEKINKSFLEKMNLQNHQYIAFVHKNTDHKHIHLYVNRIDYTGKAYDDQFISNRAAHVAEGIAKEMGLQTAKEVQQAKQKERQVIYPEMEHIKQLAKAYLAQREVNSVSKFINSFNQAGSEYGFRAEAYNNKNGTFQGLRFYAGDHKFKASDIHRSLSKQNLEHTFEQRISIMQNNSKGHFDTHMPDTNSSRSQHQEISLTTNTISTDIASTIYQTLGLFSELINVSINANRYTNLEQDQEIDRKREEEIKKKKRKLRRASSF